MSNSEFLKSADRGETSSHVLLATLTVATVQSAVVDVGGPPRKRD